MAYHVIKFRYPGCTLPLTLVELDSVLSFQDKLEKLILMWMLLILKLS